MAKTPEVGTIAPDFTLPGVLVSGGTAERGDYALSAQRGKPVVLAFYPGDNTSVCTKQLCSYTSGLDSFTGLGATVWGISPQDVDSHEAFARKYDLGFPLLADTGLTVTRQYGIGLGGRPTPVGLRDRRRGRAPVEARDARRPDVPEAGGHHRAAGRTSRLTARPGRITA